MMSRRSTSFNQSSSVKSYVAALRATECHSAMIPRSPLRRTPADTPRSAKYSATGSRGCRGVSSRSIIVPLRGISPAASRLTTEVGFAVIRLEESTNGAVRVEGDERAAYSIITRNCSIGAIQLLDASSDRRISQGLSCSQIFLSRHSAELGAVFCEMLIELHARAKADAPSIIAGQGPGSGRCGRLLHSCSWRLIRRRRVIPCAARSGRTPSNEERRYVHGSAKSSGECAQIG